MINDTFSTWEEHRFNYRRTNTTTLLTKNGTKEESVQLYLKFFQDLCRELYYHPQWYCHYEIELVLNVDNSHWSYYILDLYTAIIHWYFRIYNIALWSRLDIFTGFYTGIFYLEFYLEFYLDLFAVYSTILLTNDRINIHMINMNS